MLWQNLELFASHFKGPWVVLGEFNKISSISKKFGGNPPNHNRINQFNNFLNCCNILDLGFRGPKYTWSNLRKYNQLIMERLDRFVANPSWLNLFPKSIISHLPRTHLDHCPLLLDTNPVTSSKKKPFRLEAMWLSHPSFESIVHSNWSSTSNNFLPCVQNLTSTIFKWNNITFGNIFLQEKRKS